MRRCFSVPSDTAAPSAMTSTGPSNLNSSASELVVDIARLHQVRVELDGEATLPSPPDADQRVMPASEGDDDVPGGFSASAEFTS